MLEILTMMKTYEALSPDHQLIAKAMSDAAREVMRDEGIKPLNDDRAARFDEACAVFLNERLLVEGDPAAVRS